MILVEASIQAGEDIARVAATAEAWAQDARYQIELRGMSTGAARGAAFDAPVADVLTALKLGAAAVVALGASDG